MPQFIHLADDRELAMIRKNGIKARAIYGSELKAVYATPVLQDFHRSHQWIRELRRTGVKVISAVQFRVDDDVPVSVGRFNGEHLDVTAAEAVKIFMEHETGMGLEVIFAGSIPASAITRTYTPEQITGWRYYPESHSSGRKPCPCPYCQRGMINGQKLQERYRRSE